MGSSWIQTAYLVFKYKLLIIVGRVTQLGYTWIITKNISLTRDLNPHPAQGQISTAVHLSRLSQAYIVPHKLYTSF
ncbi:hypothetical protein TSAR_013722, partial [Trichomalopsis sarcophagae]